MGGCGIAGFGVVHTRKAVFTTDDVGLKLFELLLFRSGELGLGCDQRALFREHLSSLGGISRDRASRIRTH